MSGHQDQSDKNSLTQSRKGAKFSKYFFASWRLGERFLQSTQKQIDFKVNRIQI